MSIYLDKVAILLNGPPRAGKDTALSALESYFLGACESFKFTRPVKELTHRNAGLRVAHDHFEEEKDVPQDVFDGLTPRMAYIRTSRELKDREGEDAVARLFVEAISASPSPVILCPDVGDDMEALAVAGVFSTENVFVIRIHRDGHDFSNDCRTWVQSPLLRCVDVVNRDGRRREFLSEVVAHSAAFIDEHVQLLKNVRGAA